MAFNWVYFIVYKALGSTSDPRFVIPANSSTKADQPLNSGTLPLDLVVELLRPEYPSGRDVA